MSARGIAFARALPQAALSLRPRHTRALPSMTVRCSSNSNNEASQDDNSSSGFKGFGTQPEQKATPAEALQKSLADLSQQSGRMSDSTQVILDTTTDADKWRELDMQVNEYPGQRTFKAIGSGGDDFVAAMTACVESVVGTVHKECVSQRLSAKGNYISVTVGPVWVETPDQVLQVYENMRADGRMRFYL